MGRPLAFIFSQISRGRPVRAGGRAPDFGTNCKPEASLWGQAEGQSGGACFTKIKCRTDLTVSANSAQYTVAFI